MSQTNQCPASLSWPAAYEENGIPIPIEEKQNIMARNRNCLRSAEPTAVLLTGIGAAIWSLGALAAGVSVTPGQAVQSVRPPVSLPAAPGAVLSIPAQKQQKSDSTLPIPVQRIVFATPHLLSEATLQALARPYEGKTVTLGELQGLAREISLRYQAAGYPLAYAHIPPQSVRKGVVTIATVLPRYDQIQVSPNSRLAPGMARYTVGVAPGETITSAPLSRGLLLLQQAPGVQVHGVFLPGVQPQTSSLRLQIHNRPVLQASYGFSNYGNRYTGRFLAQLGLTLNNPFGYGSSIGINGLTSEAGLLHAGGFNVTSPNLWNGLRVGVYGSRTIYRLGGRYTPLQDSGAVNQLGVDVTYPILLQPGALLDARLDLIHNGISTQNIDLPRSRWQVNLARAGVSGAYAENDGAVTSGGLSVGVGNMGYANALAASNAPAGYGVPGHFWVLQLNAAQRQPLPVGLVLHASVSGQVASHNLDGTQQFYLGGPYGVGAYTVGSGGGDSGYLLRLRLSHDLPLPARFGYLQADALAQNGSIWQYHSRPVGFTGPNALNATSLGVGLRYAYSHWVALHLQYLHAVGGGTLSATAERGGVLWASLRGTL